MSSVDLFWIPLGAGDERSKAIVRASGRVFEMLSAMAQRRSVCNLYHSALAVRVPEGRFVIEMAPIPDGDGRRRGAVAEGPVGLRCAGRLRLFRYEIRRWLGGRIPDQSAAVATKTIDVDLEGARRLLDLVPLVPTPTWGRDELCTGEMWNSNSLTSWLLKSAGFDADVIDMPSEGRAPGWSAGLVVAARGRAPVGVV